mgnify:CR=1 FL=1
MKRVGAGFEPALPREFDVPLEDIVDLVPGVQVAATQQLECRGLDQRERGDLRLQLHRRPEGERAAAGVTDQMERFADVFGQRAHETQFVGEPERPGLVPHGFTVAVQIGREHAIASGQPRDEAAPLVAGAGAAVDQHDGGPAALVGEARGGMLQFDRGHQNPSACR